MEGGKRKQMIDLYKLFAFLSHVSDCAGFILELIKFRFERLKAKNENNKYTAHDPEKTGRH
jgi:Fe-S oxidoreductase